MVNYDAFAETFSKSRENHPWPEVDYFIEEMQKTNVKSILDIGCGNGRFVEHAEEKWFSIEKYLGIDSSKKMIGEAKKLHPGYSFEVDNMSEIGKIESEKYDALIFLASFHHLETREERLQVLKQARNLLSSFGVIYMTNWNLLEQERYNKSHRGNGDFDIKIGEHTRYYHGFTLEELDWLFRETGFEIIENRVFEGGRNIVSRITI